VRYFLLREMSFGLDASFSHEALIARRNSDLANDLGNLVSRSLTMVKNFAGAKAPEAGPLTPLDQELADAAVAMVGEYRERLASFAFRQALEAVWEVIGRANKYIVATAPWELAKDPAQGARLSTVLHTLLETLRLVTLTLHPIMPATAAKLAAALGQNAAPDFNRDSRWGLLAPGTAITLGEPLFPRLDAKGNAQAAAPKGKQETKPATKTATAAPAPAAEEGVITFDHFQQVELRVAEVVAAQKVPKADRLLQLTVKAPEERTIVAGIAEYYEPEQLVGKKVIIVANLKPAKLKGILSQGMVLAAKAGDRLVLSTVDGDIPPGSKVA
jgi:methionyl-tRNA synthetase